MEKLRMEEIFKSALYQKVRELVSRGMLSRESTKASSLLRKGAKKIMPLRNKFTRVFIVQHSERLADLERKMKRAANVWLEGAIREREFFEALPLFMAAIEEPGQKEMNHFEDRIDEIIHRGFSGSGMRRC